MRGLSLLLMAMCFFVSSCKERKPSCELTKNYAEIVGAGIADLFACKNKTRIALDLQSTIEDLNLCENPDQTQTGVVAGVICKPAAKFVTGVIVKTVLPNKWECSGGAPASAAENYIFNACLTLPF